MRNAADNPRASKSFRKMTGMSLRAATDDAEGSAGDKAEDHGRQRTAPGPAPVRAKPRSGKRGRRGGKKGKRAKATAARKAVAARAAKEAPELAHDAKLDVELDLGDLEDEEDGASAPDGGRD